MEINKILMEEFNLKAFQVDNTIKLLDEGNTIPFIARYRKEQTGTLEDVVLRQLSNRLNYLRNLEEKKEEVIRLIGDQGKLTDSLREEILKSESLQKIDDLYRPFRPKRRTRATIAKEKGLEPLAKLILEEKLTSDELLKEAEKYISEPNEVETAERALEHAMDIIAEIVSDDPSIRDKVRNYFYRYGIIESKATASDEKTVYEMYYDFKEPIKSVANHRVLAMNRGEKDKKLKISIDLPNIDMGEFIIKQLVETEDKSNYYRLAIVDGYNRLLFPSIEREIRNDLKEKAEEDAIGIFALNLEPLLMQPPIKGKNVMAIDPGFRTGCKAAVIDETGKLLDYVTVYPTEPRNEVEKTQKILKDLVEKYQVSIIAIGNGTASRETENVVAGMIRENALDISYIIVSEAGASIYSASEVGIKEFPNIDVSIRGAVSIGRRLQDPLAELVKIEPRHIGVGQYQHDLNQKKLDESLAAVVEDSVNTVGVDINTASPSLLSYVAGISSKVADNIVSHREEIGKFKTRAEIKKIKGLGPKTFVQCAGFLRIPGGSNPLDNTGVHPESYKVAEVLVKEGYKNIDLEEVAKSLDVGLPTLEDIIRELEKPGRDPRDGMPKPILRQDVLKIEDLEKDMLVKGTVRNVVDFGAFVDIGVTEDGLVHISHLSNKFVKHPKDVVQVGDIVDVKIIDIDKDKGRIALSMKEI